MANSTEGKTETDQVEETDARQEQDVEDDAVETVSEASDDADVTSTEPVEDDATEDSGSDEDPDSEADEILDEAADDDESAETADDQSDDVEPEPIEAEDLTPQPMAAPEPVPAPQTTVVRKGGFVPMVFGGLIAGALGYGASYYQNTQDTAPDYQALIDAQAATISELQAQIAAIPAAPDLSGVEGAIAASTADLQSLSGDLGALVARVDDLEKAPSADGTFSDTAIAAYEREVQELRGQIEEALSLSQQASLAQAEAEQMAAMAAQQATALAAVGRIQAAIDTGAAFDGALADLTANADVEVPTVLTDAAAEGVPSVADLRDSFPEMARAALSAARSEGVDETGGGVGGFLRSQFNVRSVAPREGSDPDAILSRAEAAVRDGRLTDAMGEIDALPEVVRAELTDWTAAAQMRADALSAIETLSQNLNQN